MVFQIETRTPVDSEFASIYNRDWNAESVGDGNCFATEAEAEQAIAGMPALGPDWVAAEYRIVEVAPSELGMGCSEFRA